MSIKNIFEDEPVETGRDLSQNQPIADAEIVNTETTVLDPDILRSKLPEHAQLVEGDKYRLAASLDQQVAAGSWLATNALYTIKQYNFHKTLGDYKSFDDLVRERYPFIGATTAKKWIRIITTLGDGPEVKQLFQSGAQKQLTEIARRVEKEDIELDDNGKEFVIVNGEKIEKDVYAKQIAEQIEADYKAKLESVEYQLETANSKLTTEKNKLEKETEAKKKLQTNVDALAKSTGLDPELIAKARNAKEVSEILSNAYENFHVYFQKMVDIDYKLRSEASAVELQSILAMVKGRIIAVEKNWLDHLELIKE